MRWWYESEVIGTCTGERTRARACAIATPFCVFLAQSHNRDRPSGAMHHMTHVRKTGFCTHLASWHDQSLLPHTRARVAHYSLGRWAFGPRTYIRTCGKRVVSPFSISAGPIGLLPHTCARVGHSPCPAGLWAGPHIRTCAPSLEQLNNLLAILDDLACPLLVSTWILTETI